VVLAPGLRDVSHEYSCQFRAATGAQARVWVFAAPVTRRVAGALARDARSQKRCRPAGLETRLGVPSAGTLCAGPIGAGRRPDRVMVLRGLFGDAWLSCQLTTPPTVAAGEVVRRADRWCVQVATTLGGLS
jgi:hypothetical protein